MSDLSTQDVDLLLSSVKAIFTFAPGTPQRAEAVAGYVAAIQRTFLIGVPSAALGAISALILKRERMKKSEGAGGAVIGD